MNLRMLIKSHTVFLSLVILGLIVAISFGQATGFALWQDDNALIFKLQHLEERVGYFGAGPFGIGAYRYIAVPYIPIYKLFGANILVFYLWAIFFYFLASISVFFLALQITRNKLLAFLSGAIFAAGFIGSDGILRLFNSIQTSYSVTFTCLFFLFLWRFVRGPNVRDYLVALTLFFITLETAFIRTQYLILPAVVFLILFLNWGKLNKGLKNIFLIVPFILVYHSVFTRSADARATVVKDYIDGLLSGKFEYTYSFFGSLGNIFLPQPITDFLFYQMRIISWFYSDRLLILELIFLVLAIVLTNLVLKNMKLHLKVLFSLLSVFWFIFGVIYLQNAERIFSHSEGFDTLGIFANFIGGLFLILQVVIFFVLVNRNRETGKILLFVLFWLTANILAFSTYLPFSPFESINRYLVHSLAAFALIIPISFCSIWKKAGIVICLIVVFTNILFSINYQYNFVADKSLPTNEFYRKFRQYVPEIKKGSVFYFDVAKDGKSQQEFRDFFSVASMPNSTAIAIRYGVDRYDFTMTGDFNEYLSLIADKTTNEAFSFFYSSQQGLVDTTSMTRENLSRGKQVILKSLEDVKKLGLSLATPAVLEFSARANPQITIQGNCGLTIEEKNTFFSYLLSRDNFFKNVRVKTNSEERYLGNSFITDNNVDTLWRGNRGLWHSKHNEEILLALGSIRNIGQLVWTNGYANSTPIDFRIETSVNGIDWNNVKSVINGGKKGNGYVVEDNFSPEKIRYIKLVITRTFDNDSPAISEIEAVESDFVGINKENFKKSESKAFCVRDQSEINTLINFIERRGIEFNVSWKTDKNTKNTIGTNFKADNLYHDYQVSLYPGGTQLNEIKITSELIPTEIALRNIKIVYLNKEKLSPKAEVK